MERLPLVDLCQVTSHVIPTEDDYREVADEIRKALETVGFLNLINHGIPKQKVDRAFQEAKHFFELDAEAKLKYSKDMTKGIKGYHGYSSPINQEGLVDTAVVKVTELRESFDINPCEPSPKFPDLEAPNLRPALLDLENAFRPLIMKLMKIIAISLGHPDDTILSSSSKSVLDPRNIQSFNSFRCNYYPVVPDSVLPRTVRCSEHTDWGLFTLLFQDTVGGLEVRSKDTWVHAEPIDGAILMNTGDMLQIFSGGRFPATFHRVLIPENEIRRRTARQSILYFLFPDDDMKVVPLTETTDPALLKETQWLTSFEHTKTRSESLYY